MSVDPKQYDELIIAIGIVIVIVIAIIIGIVIARIERGAFLQPLHLCQVGPDIPRVSIVVPCFG